LRNVRDHASVCHNGYHENDCGHRKHEDGDDQCQNEERVNGIENAQMKIMSAIPQVIAFP